MDANTRKALTEVTAILTALLSDEAPAKPARTSTKKAAPKAAPKADPKVRLLCKANRRAFVAAAPEFEGMSTKAIAAMCVEDPSLVPAGFGIGAGYTALFTA